MALIRGKTDGVDSIDIALRNNELHQSTAIFEWCHHTTRRKCVRRPQTNTTGQFLAFPKYILVILCTTWWRILLLRLTGALTTGEFNIASCFLSLCVVGVLDSAMALTKKVSLRCLYRRVDRARYYGQWIVEGEEKCGEGDTRIA
ncbi:hypothetical protein BDR06DRAFT_960695 [Suillus hirtellus]|nr:hypothetical protein BDR06DRAFT_960695 [Suillus hirtellus]